MNTFTPPTFEKEEVRDWLDYLEEHGYSVIRDVLEQEVINDSLELFWKDWNTVSPGFVRTDPTTWGINTAPMMFAKGMAVFNGFGQSDFMWNLRLQKSIQTIFQEIHKTEHLITSFDGFSVFFSKKQKSDPWWHIDQHPSNQILSVQGAYNFLPVTKQSAGFTIVPGSHTSFSPSQTKDNPDWIQVYKNKSKSEADNIIASGVKLLVPGNSFILWSSRSIHANTGPTHNDIRLDRLTAYITMIPKSVKLKEKRLDAYRNGETCSHWPNKVEIKRYPWGFGPRYIAKGFHKIVPLPEIPKERLALI